MKCIHFISVLILSTLCGCYGINSENSSIGHINSECIDQSDWSEFIVVNEDSLIKSFENYEKIDYSLHQQVVKHDLIIHLEDLNITYFMNFDTTIVRYLYDPNENKDILLNNYDLDEKKKTFYLNNLQSRLLIHQKSKEARIISLNWMLQREEELLE
tara:strand:- start:881 stop:1351 length:471 start_codon:yes stop_codon:yes gene_type:complete